MSIHVSVVVPTYKRTDLLSRCLAALAVQDYDPASYEVIVADDAASTETQALVECWHEHAHQTRGGPDLCYLPVTRAHGPAAARNRGWKSARGEHIAFTDDDTIPAPDWLRAGVAELGKGYDACSGQVVVPVPPEPTDYERNAAGLETAEFLTANCFLRRAMLQVIGGFDEQFRLAWREDSDLFMKLVEHNADIGFAEDAVVLHPIRPAQWGVCLKQQQRNFYNPLLYKKHRVLYPRWIQTSPRRRYYSLVAALGAAMLTAIRGPRFLALAAFGYWAYETSRFAGQRLSNTSHAPQHIAEMIVTSALIPPLAIYWRLRGAVRWRVWFW